MSLSPFELIMPDELTVPILISVPHAGTSVTESFSDRVAGDHILQLPDTDWYVDQLYQFATELGIPLIYANYSRYIVDLNRQLPGQQQLYVQEAPLQAMPGYYNTHAGGS